MISAVITPTSVGAIQFRFSTTHAIPFPIISMPYTISAMNGWNFPASIASLSRRITPARFSMVGVAKSAIAVFRLVLKRFVCVDRL